MVGITTSALAKIGKGEDVLTQILIKIFGALECGIEDIFEVMRYEE